MVMVGSDGKVSEGVVAICRLRWSEFVASRDVVGDAMLRVSSNKIAMIAPENDIAQTFAG